MTAENSTFKLTPQEEAGKVQFLRRQFFEAPAKVSPGTVDISGRTAVVTGASSGLGLECSRQLLELGIGRLVLAVRDQGRGEAARETLTATKPLGPNQTIEIWTLDYASYESILSFVHRVEQLSPLLDIAILNAGVHRGLFNLNPETGHEETLQTNYLSTALLALLLLGTFDRAKSMARGNSRPSPGRIVVVSSDMAAWAQFNERNQEQLLKAFDSEASWHKLDRYATSKLLGQLFVSELARRVPSSLAVVNCANPGLCHGSNLANELGLGTAVFVNIVGHSPAVGARSLIHAAVKQDKKSHGQYIENGEIRPMAPFVYSNEARHITERLWEETLEELSFAGVKDIVSKIASDS